MITNIQCKWLCNFSENIDLRPCSADISQGCPPARVLHGSRQVLTAIGINHIITGSLVWKPEPCFNMKTISRYRQSHYKDKTVSRLSYFYNRNSYPGKWCNVAFIERMHRRKTILLSILVRQSLYVETAHRNGCHCRKNLSILL